MHWIPLVVWIAALVVAVVVLGFCAYEIGWKTKRLRRDLAQLQELTGLLTSVQESLVTVRQRVATAAQTAAPPAVR